MASVKMGAVVTEMAGKIGGTVFRRTKTGISASNIAYGPNSENTISCSVESVSSSGVIKVCCTAYYSILSPVNDYTNCYSFYYNVRASTNWKNLTEPQKNTWNTGAVNYPAANKFGAVYTPSGFQVFCKLNSGRLMVQQPLLVECPAVPSLIDVVNPVFTVNTDGIVNLTLNEPIDDSSRLVVYATAPMGKGRSKKSSNYKLIAIVGNAYGLPIDISESYWDKFGCPCNISKINFKYQVINVATGYKNAFAYTSATSKVGNGLAVTLNALPLGTGGADFRGFSWSTENAVSVSVIFNGSEVAVSDSGEYSTDVSGNHLAIVKATDIDGNIMMRRIYVKVE